MVMNVLVTGAAGFIGSHLTEALLRRGDRVCALDNFDDFYAAGIKRANLKSCVDHPRFQLVEGDIRDPATVARCVDESTDAVVHLAARAGVRPSIEQPLLYQDVNIRGTMVLLERCKMFPSCRLVFASSSSVYGNRADVPFRESDRVDDPISPYAATKKAGELLVHTYHHLYGLPATCLRFFTVYGPRQRPDLAISLFMNRIARGEPIPVFGDGTMSRDYTFIDDIVAGAVAAYERIPDYGYRVWNLGGSRPVTLSEMIEAVERIVGRRAVIDRRPPPPGDVERTFADLSRSEAELGFRPRISFDEGLSGQWEWMKRHSAAPGG